MRRTYVRIIVLITTLVLAACAPGTDQPAASPAATTADTAALAVETITSAETPPAGLIANTDEPVTITFAASEEEFPLFEPLIAWFQADNPNIRVQLVDINQAATTITMANGDVMTAIGPESIRKVLSLADTATGIGPTHEAIANGWVRDLTPLMDADPTFDRADFYPNTLAPEPNGRIYTLPAKQYVDLLAYNKELWASRGLPPPQPGWTWNDLKAAAQQLARKRGNTVEVYGMVDWGPGLPALLAELAEAGFQRDPAAPLRLDDPAIVAALERIVALARSGAYAGGADFRQQILNQQVGIWPATPNMLVGDRGTTSPQPSFAVGIVPRPIGYSGVLGYVMSAGTQHPNEAWRWLSFLSRQFVAEPYANANPAGVIPARRSVAEQSGYWKRLDAETTALIQAVLDRHVPVLLLPDFGLDAEAPLHAAIEEAITSKQTPATALRQAQVELERQLTQVTPEPTPASNQIVVATPMPAAPAGAVAITFGAPGDASPIDQIAQAFNQQNLGVFVQVKHVDLTTGRPASMAELADETDCFIGAAAPTSDEIVLLRDLRPLLDADPGFTLDDYPQVVLEQFQRDTKLYGLPDGIDFRVLNYNQSAFDAVGLAHPTAEWTLDDFAHAARRLQGTGSNAQYGFASTFLQWRDVFFVLDRFGVSAASGQGADIQPNFTDPQVAQAIHFYLDLLRGTSPHERLSGYRRGDAIDSDVVRLVRAGRVGMWFDFGSFGAVAEADRVTRAIAPPPLGQGVPTANDFRSSGLYISAKNQQPEACWTWLKALSSEITHLQGAFPARISLAESDAFLQQAAPGSSEVYKAYRAAFRHPSSGPAVQPASQSAIDYYWFFRAIDRALQGKDLERELADAQAITWQFLDCMRAGAKGGGCAKQVDPAYQGWRYATPDSN